MINDNIQELFDGTLGDEQSAELLHLLSVNPERRADFRRYIALQEAMRRDRVASTLSNDEDSEIWGVLAGLGGAAAATTTGSNVLNWVARAAAVVVVGIVGYLLGSNSSTNIFADRSEGSGAATIVGREGSGSATAALPPLATAQQPASRQGEPREASATAAPRVIYRDRIVYKYSPSSHDAAALASNDHGGASDGRNAAAKSPDAMSPESALRTDAANGTATQQPKTSAPDANGATTSTKTEGNGAKASVPTLDPNSVLGAEKLRSGADQPSEPAADPVAASILRDGFEVGLSDHEGLISPAPSGEESDPSFSNRNVDLSYRILDGRFGLGARFGYGSFAMVSLGSTLRARSNAKGELASVETKLYPVLQPQKQFLTEFFLNYRLPIATRFAVGLESSLGVSAKHTKAGGDASLLWFFGEHMGMHAGAGLGYYWYDLTSANEEAIRNSPDNTSVVEMSDSYHGTVLEFKYGIFYHF